MNNLIIRTEQLDGIFVTQETMNRLVEQLSALSAFQFHALERYIKRNLVTDDQRVALFGSNLNLSLEHRIQGYFGPKTVPCAVEHLTPAQRKEAIKYYCNCDNYRIRDWNGNVFDGSSPLMGPCMTFVVKFMEEILGFKNSPDGKYQFGTNGQRLSKPMVKMAPLVGFNNNFQPEEYMDAPNKTEYMRSLTVVQKILALEWMIRGQYAFREDLAPIADKNAQLKKQTYARLVRAGPDAAPTGVKNAIAQDDFRSQPLFQQVQYLYEMVGGSLSGRCNQKLSPDGRVSRADFMAASLNQQTMWLYRQLQGFDEDGDEDSGLRKHLGKYYSIGASEFAIRDIRKLSKGRLSHQTRYLGKRVLKHEKRLQSSDRRYKLLEARVKRAEGNIALIKKKTFSDKDQLKDKLGEFDKEINKGAGIFSKLNLINMIAGYAIDAVVLVVASTGLAYAVEAKYRLDDHDKKFGKIYRFLTDDLYTRFQFIWDEFSHLNDDVTKAHLEAQRAGRRSSRRPTGTASCSALCARRSASTRNDSTRSPPAKAT
ncbi:Spindle pole protein, putative [Giardia duodenalis ATCC 50581]|uniref:Spindle pole protein, putative n=1 Tax=Giardia intestinalis (strain ATCC 50581 / GS clone H7) TaxID=598745 RepID=C6LW82_GIAIB|nr:Spindle pole protein, putative [Giardia intestinalis ATCC 50581]